jgi:chemotaxis protein methyltransferase CheR
MSLPRNLLAEASAFVMAQLGLNFTADRSRDLERALRSAALEAGYDGPEPYVRWLLNAPLTPQQLELLASKLTVGETYFFREPQIFAALREHIIPEWVAARGRPQPPLRVWSAGCCTGEEPYSLAIFFARECPELRGSVSIVATDLNAHFLRKARAGVYRSWSFRNAPSWLQPAYFTRVGQDRFELRPEIRQMVTFEHLNLAVDTYPALHNHTNGVDLIFCRNVLMYFSEAHVRRVVDGFHRSLAESGFLVVSVCETSPTLAPQFRSRGLKGVTVYQKTSRPKPSEPPASAPEPLAAPFADFPLSHSASAKPPAFVRSPEKPTLAAQVGDAHARLRAGDYAAAAAKLEAVLAQSPLHVDAAALLGRALANQGRLADALRWIELAISADKLRAPLHYLRATVLQELGRLDLASGALEKALYLDPDFVLAHFAVADLARQAGRSEKSLRHLNHALRVLRRLPPGEAVPESDDLTVGRLIAVIESMLTAEVSP